LYTNLGGDLAEAMVKLTRTLTTAWTILVISTLVLVCLPTGGLAQEVEWDKTFGGPETDCGLSAQQTRDGGYIIAATTRSFGAGNLDIWLIKTDSSGNQVWDKTFGGPEEDRVVSALQTQDGGYIIAGEIRPIETGQSPVWLIKTDSSGNKVWDKTLGSSELHWVGANDFQQTSDGGYIFTGEARPHEADETFVDVWLAKTDALGNKEWERTFGDSHSERGFSVQQTQDGGYIIAGEAWSSSYSQGMDKDAWLIKTDASGNKEWDKTFEGTEEAWSVQQMQDGGYIVAGQASRDVWLMRTDASGNRLWDKTFGGSEYDEGYSVQQTRDGGYIIAGRTPGQVIGDSDIWLVKTNASGKRQWDRAFGGSDMDWATSVQQTSDGGYIVAGTRGTSGQSDVWLIKLKADEEGAGGLPFWAWVIIGVGGVLVISVITALATRVRRYRV
jgi:hypothetical protein